MAASYEDCARINRISQETGVPCFVAYYRRYLPYFQKVRQMVENGEIGNVINIQIRFAQPPRNLDYNSTNLPWRVQADIAGGGYFYDLAPHQLDLLQDMFGCILEAEGYKKVTGWSVSGRRHHQCLFQNLIRSAGSPAHGALWHMNLPKKTASKSLATKE